MHNLLTRRRLLQGGVSYALEDAPLKLPFLEGLAQVCARIPANKAELLLEHVQHSISGQTANEEDPEWQDYFDFVALTQDRTAKGGQPRSALKGRPQNCSTRHSSSRLHARCQCSVCCCRHAYCLKFVLMMSDQQP